jgi:hypothetical protein
MIVICQDNSTASTEHKKCRSVSGWEGIAVMHVHPLYQRQYHIGMILEYAYRAVITDKML